MIQNSVYSILFFILFYFLWDSKPVNVPSIRETWIWNKEGKFGTNAPKQGENPFSVLNGYKTNLGFYSFSSGKEKAFLLDHFVDFPLLSKGFLEYEKIGDLVHFYSEKGELFWTKPINSYPRSGLYSAPVLYLSGDNNTVFLLDTSGNSIGLKELNGRFLTDYSFLLNGTGAVVLFSGGELYRIDEKGNRLFEKNLSSESSESFFKSVTASPNGVYTAVHFSKGSADSVLVLNEKGEVKSEIKIPNFYPHKINFVISDSGNLLFNLPDRILFFDQNKLKWEKEKSKVGGVYQVTFSLPNFLIYLDDTSLVFLNSNGNLIRSKKIPPNENPLRLFPGKDLNHFYLETKSDIYQFRIN